jgi:hypothetical protein
MLLMIESRMNSAMKIITGEMVMRASGVAVSTGISVSVTPRRSATR